MAAHASGMLIEYTVDMPPLGLVFAFNPQTISRTRTVSLPSSSGAGVRGGYDFTTPLEVPRAAQGVTLAPETFSIEVLFDGTGRSGPLAGRGVEPELDVLRTMLEPKHQGPPGARLLGALGAGPRYAFQRDETVSVVLFVWGDHILPVFLTSVRVEELQHLPSLAPVRAKATISLQVIEGANPFYLAEKVKQSVGATLYATTHAAENLAGLAAGIAGAINPIGGL